MRTLIRIVTIGLSVAGLAPAGTAAAENWNPVSRSSQYIYLADADSIAQSGDDTTILVARAPVGGAARAHRVQTYTFQCARQQFRIVHTAEFEDDAQIDAYDEEGAEYETVPRNSLIEAIKEIACDGNRASPPTWPSIAAYLDSRS